jgi:hypothetical protein
MLGCLKVFVLSAITLVACGGQSEKNNRDDAESGRGGGSGSSGFAGEHGKTS